MMCCGSVAPLNYGLEKNQVGFPVYSSQCHILPQTGQNGKLCQRMLHHHLPDRMQHAVRCDCHTSYGSLPVSVSAHLSLCPNETALIAPKLLHKHGSRMF